MKLSAQYNTFSRLSAVLLIIGAFQSVVAAAGEQDSQDAAVAQRNSNAIPAPQQERFGLVTGALPKGSAAGDINGVSDGNAVRAVVRSVQNVTIGSELNARIKAMPFRDGDDFAQGDVLVQFDCARTNAEFAAALANYNSHRIAHDSIVRMQQYQAAGSFAVDQAKYELEKSQAEMQSLEAKRDTCTILAPFKGRVVEKLAQAYEVAQPNQPLLKIVESTAQELVLMVPSHWLAEAKIGSSFSVRIDETGQSYRATVTQVGGAIDPISQSVRMIGEIKAPVDGVAPGMSGTATFNFAQAKP
jgi:membrane fusion protein, multidrug efflux system